MANELNVRTPLFDRLTQRVEAPSDARVAGGERTLDRRGLLASVRRELELLFNTRSSFPAHRLPGAPLTVIDYGIPTLTDYAARNPNHQNELAEALRIAIAAYEPRLAAVRVQVIPPPEDQIFLNVSIEGELIADSVREPVSFLLGVDLRQTTVTVDAL